MSDHKGRSRTEKRGPGALDARAEAARVIGDCLFGGARANESLDRRLRSYPGADPRDRALSRELVYGVLRWKRRLEHTLIPHVRQRFEQLEPMAQVLLLVGAYQIFFLDRIPAPIAVSATQDTARRLKAGRLSGLLNAVLRRVADKGEKLPEGHDDASIGVRASLPDWIVAELRALYGDEGLEAEALALRERAPNAIRPTLAKGGAEQTAATLAEEGFTCEPGPHGTLIFGGSSDPFLTKAYRDGLFLPQDPSSLAVLDLLGDVDGQQVLDLCAGRGIKATALADRGARVTAADISAKKLDAAGRVARRLGLADRISFVEADATLPDLTIGEGRFPLVLVDAPCTGLGTLRRHPEIAWRATPGDAFRLAELGGRLMATAARQLAPGGTVCYAVCTFTRIEGQPTVPSGLEPTGRTLAIRPTAGNDAFQAACWRKTP